MKKYFHTFDEAMSNRRAKPLFRGYWVLLAFLALIAISMLGG